MENQKMTVSHFGFTKKVYGLPFSTTLQQHLVCRRRAASASINIIITYTYIYECCNSEIHYSASGHCDVLTVWMQTLSIVIFVM